MVNVYVYADGSCHNNGQENAKAGWGTVLDIEGRKRKLTQKGIVPGAQTNSRAELSAVICGIELAVSTLKDKEFTLIVRTDSKYVTDAVNQKWIHKWVKNGWLTTSKKPVQNVDLWKGVITACKKVGTKVIFEHVEGHAGDELNEMADKLANEAAR